MDKVIKKVLNTIEKSGYEAYVVGGYVRDSLMNKTSYDVDICTNAKPKDIKVLFKNCELTSYGNVFFKIKKYDFEITTYRKELKYENRRPKEMIYINNLIEDLLRRDFTINTICLNQNNEIIDLLEGIKDIKNKTIKIVGDPDLKLKEDPLRILRAIRFATVLDFEIDLSLSKAIIKNYEEVKKLSNYRIKEELDKILISDNVLKGFDLLKKYHILESLRINADNLVKVNDLMGMWAQIDYKGDFPFTKEEKNNIIKIREIIQKGYIDDFMLYRYGLYLCSVASEILMIDKKLLNKKYKKLPIHSIKDICISVDNINKFLGMDKKNLGDIVNNLVLKILSKEVPNNKKNVLKYLSGIKENYYDNKRNI